MSTGTGSFINTTGSFINTMKGGRQAGHERLNSSSSGGGYDNQENALFSNEPLKLGTHLKTNQDIHNYWEYSCKRVPIVDGRNDRIGMHLRENEHLMFKLESVDMWCHIKLFMFQGKYNIDAVMDLKIERNMNLRDFKMLLQKLALQMWNRCVTVF